MSKLFVVVVLGELACVLALLWYLGTHDADGNPH